MLHIWTWDRIVWNDIFVICSSIVKRCETWLRLICSFRGLVCFGLFQLDTLSGLYQIVIKWLLDSGLNCWRWDFAFSRVRLADMIFQTWVCFEKVTSAFDSKFGELYLLELQLSNVLGIFPIRVHRRGVMWVYHCLCVMLRWVANGDYVVLVVFDSTVWVFDIWKLNRYW